jgi:hypothetical protein
MNRWLVAVIAGVSGALSFTLLAEAARRRYPRRPSLERVRERALQRLLGRRAPRGVALRRTALGVEGFGNALLYGLAIGGRSRHPFLRGTLAGMFGAFRSLVLAPRFVLGGLPRRMPHATRRRLVAAHLASGLAAATAARAIGRREPASA